MAIVEGQEIKAKWHGANRKHYESRGYKYKGLGVEFLINIEDLPATSHTKVEIRCDYCGKHRLKRYDAINHEYNRTFCNSRCYGKWLSESEDARDIWDKKISQIEVNCFECKKPFMVVKSVYEKQDRHFCSRSCLGKTNFRERNPNPKKDKIRIKCSYCLEKLEIHESKSKNTKDNFCSRECYYKFRSENYVGDLIHNYSDVFVHCDTCGDKIKVTQYKLDTRKNHFCSSDCYGKYRKANYSGENHNQYGMKKSEETIEKMRIITTKLHNQGVYPQTETKIHKKVNEILDDMKIEYKNEYSINYYSIDIYLTEYDLFIEIMGDYWHANPIRYNDLSSTNSTQRKDIKRDKSKFSYIKKYFKTTPLYLWESDIDNDIELCKELINLFVKNNGGLDNFQSFNYELLNNQLVLLDNVIEPHFIKDQIIYQ